MTAESGLIRSVDTRFVPIRLSRPWGAEVASVSVIEVIITTDSGDRGFGFSWTPSIGSSAVKALLDDDLARYVIGHPAETALWDGAWAHLHEAGGGGITTLALAGIDLALWDLTARRSSVSVTDLIGRRHDRLPVYGSGVNLHYDESALVAQVKRWVALGHNTVKIKVGKPDLAEDIDRVAAVRDVLGKEHRLLLDANQRWDLGTAVRSINALAVHDIGWIEEPLRADDLPAHVALRAQIDVPVALGENIHTLYRFREFLDAEAVDVIQPNVIRVGGITPLLRIADLARERGTGLALHLLPELSAQIAFAIDQPTWIEDVEDARFADLGALQGPTGLSIRDGWVSGGPADGFGIRFNEPALPHRS